VLLRVKLGLIVLLLAAGCAGREETTPSPPSQSSPQVVAAPPAYVDTLPAQPMRSGPAKVGLLLPLTGPGGGVGADFEDAAQLALFDVGRTDLELLPRDTGEQPAMAEQAARSALAEDAELLLGPLYGRSASAVGPIANAIGVRVLSFSNDASVASPGVYVLGFRPEEQVARVVKYAAAQGRTRFAALAPSDAYGQRVLTAWRQAVAEVPGASAVVAVTFPPDVELPRSEIQQLAAFGRPGGVPPEPPVEPLLPDEPPPPPLLPLSLPAPGFDALLIADGGKRVSDTAALLAYYDITPRNVAMLGTMRWQDDLVLMSDPKLQGAWLATWPPSEIATFERRFADTYGRNPAPLSVLAYDATALAVLLSQGQPRFTGAQITDPQGFQGAAGIFRLLPSGIAEHGLAIVEIMGGQVRVLDPAPPRFEAGFASR
jgi:ABC-type branched-subunit amino acid transport system substrate-binding protein